MYATCTCLSRRILYNMRSLIQCRAHTRTRTPASGTHAHQRGDGAWRFCYTARCCESNTHAVAASRTHPTLVIKHRTFCYVRAVATVHANVSFCDTLYIYTAH